MTCPYTTPSQTRLPTETFSRLHPDGRRLIHLWHRRAIAAGQQSDGSPFEAFIFLWFSFNGFSTCITGLERDADIIKKMGNCPDLRLKFLQLLERNQEFNRSSHDFAELWPIFKVQNLRRLNLLNSLYSTRQEQVSHYLSVPGADHFPQCFEYHLRCNGSVPLDWPHTLQAVYRVRCNLFHGEKSPTAKMDARIVRQAFTVLSMFIEGPLSGFWRNGGGGG